MVHAFVSLLAAAEGEKSKTPFYIVGCLFGAWAIALYLIGRSAPAFPSSKGAANGMMAASVLMAVTCGALAIYVA